MTTRRQLLSFLGAGALGISLTTVARAQKVRRVGILFVLGKTHPRLETFFQEFRQLGYIEGQNVAIVGRFAEGKLELLPQFAAELAAEEVDVIFASSTNAAQAARQATASIPIVFSVVSDPVGSGFVASLGRPGGNMTGTTSMNRDLAAKRLQILKEAFPRTSRVAVFITDEPQVAPQLDQVQQAAKVLGISVLTTQLRSRDDFERTQKALRSWRADAIYVVDSAINGGNAGLLAEFAVQIRLPNIFAEGLYAELGGLVSYGANFLELYRRAAHYVDRILKGAKPAELPVEQPTKFELVINMKTAKALGITISQSVLVRADRMIQ
jgi:putative ABC transport system substrate-binding protein